MRTLRKSFLDLSGSGNDQAWRRIEAAKRRFLYRSIRCKLPVVSRKERPDNGLTFISSKAPKTSP